MNVLEAIRREQRKIERQVSKFQRELDKLNAAAKALGSSASDGFGRA